MKINYLLKRIFKDIVRIVIIGLKVASHGSSIKEKKKDKLHLIWVGVLNEGQWLTMAKKVVLFNGPRVGSQIFTRLETGLIINDNFHSIKYKSRSTDSSMDLQELYFYFSKPRLSIE